MNEKLPNLFDPTSSPEGLEEMARKRYMLRDRKEPYMYQTESLPETHPLLFTPRKAVSYLRVSTRGQAERGGGDSEGFSIPAQREANRNKAASLGAIIIREFVDRGASAKSADRPELQAMLEYVEENDIDYVIVHKVDRLARNRADDLMITQKLNDTKTRLVSTTESIDDSPSGMLLHGIMSSIAEFYSQNLANEVIKGMTQKVRSGGTVSKVPLGYKNIGMIDDKGREERTVIIDEKRGPLIRCAFEMFATGNWTVADLADYLASRGLDTAPTPKVPSRPISGNALNKLLVHPFYKGYVPFRGVLYPGKHEPLVDEDTWQKVQDVLSAHTNGERTREHPHFLKGTVYCGNCGSRLIISMAKSRSGIRYPYFVCSGRHAKRTDCKQKTVLIDEVEQRIEDYYEHIALKPEFKENLKEVLLEEIKKTKAESGKEQQDYRLQKEKLERERDKLMQAHYADAIPLDLLRAEQDRIARELLEITRRLETAARCYDEIEHNLELALEIAEDCGKAYRNAPDHIKKIFNRTLFKCIYVDSDTDIRPELKPPFDILLDPRLHASVRREEAKLLDNTEKSAISDGSPDSLFKSMPQTTFFSAHGLNKRLLVGRRGIEPRTL